MFSQIHHLLQNNSPSELSLHKPALRSRCIPSGLYLPVGSPYLLLPSQQMQESRKSQN